MRQRMVWLSSLGMGAATALLFDPTSGNRWRRRIGDAAVHLTHRATNAVSTVGRDLRNRTRGVVASAHFATRTRGNPTFLNLDKPYPSQIFTVLIWGIDRAKFGAPEALYQAKHICATGTIESYRGVPEIIAREPGQIQPDGK